MGLSYGLQGVSFDEVRSWGGRRPMPSTDFGVGGPYIFFFWWVGGWVVWDGWMDGWSRCGSGKAAGAVDGEEGCLTFEIGER